MVTIRILINFLQSRYVCRTTVSWYSQCVVYCRAPNSFCNNFQIMIRMQPHTINSLCLIVTIQHPRSQRINIVSGHGSLPDTKPLPEPLLTSHLWFFAAFTWQNQNNVSNLLLCILSLKIIHVLLKICHISQGQWVHQWLWLYNLVVWLCPVFCCKTSEKWKKKTYRFDKKMNPKFQASDWRTDRHRQTDRQTQATTIPKGQNWPPVKTFHVVNLVENKAFRERQCPSATRSVNKYPIHGPTGWKLLRVSHWPTTWPIYLPCDCGPRASPLCVQHCIQLTSFSFQVNWPSHS